MSQENVELVRTIYEALARRDRETILGLYDEEVEVRWAEGTLADHFTGKTGRVFTGHEGMRNFDRDLREAFENFETNYEELVDLGPQVLSVSRYRARGRQSGVEIDGPQQFGVWTIRAGKVIHVSWHPSRDEALDAARARPTR